MNLPRVNLGLALGLALLLYAQPAWASASPFTTGLEAYAAGEYARAARAFSESARVQPSAGAFLNLGTAEWQRGRTGDAILAWERACWLDPFNQAARHNLRFARETAQLEAPELAWHEVGSTWLPADWWAWMAGASLWFAVALLTLPGFLRWRKRPWQQAAAAVGFGVLLVSLPAHIGVLTHSRLGFVLEKDVPLRLTPTAEAEAVTRLAAGEPGRRVQARGDYVFIRTRRASGWVRGEEFGLVSAW